MSTPEQPSSTGGGYGFTPVPGARMPIPGNGEFAVFFLVWDLPSSSRVAPRRDRDYGCNCGASTSSARYREGCVSAAGAPPHARAPSLP
jgi:hypothetical protein